MNTLTLFSQVKSIPENIKAQIDENDQLAAKSQQEGNLSEAVRYFNLSANLLQNNNAIEPAIEYYLKVLDLNEKLDNQKGIQLTCNNLGMLYTELEDYSNAITYLQKSLALSRQFKQKTDIVSGLTNLAVAQQGLNRQKDAVNSLEESIKLAKELNDIKLLRRCYGLIYDSYDKLGNTQKSYEYFDLYSTLDKAIKKQEMQNVQENAKTEVNKANSEKQLTEEELKVRNSQLIKTKDSLQMAEALAKEQRIEIELNKTQLRIEKMKRLQLTIGLGFFLLFTMILAFLLYQNIKAKRKINEQKDLLEKQNKNITASIRYAKTIQQAILPDITLIKDYFDSFIIYLPKDIVSGDFYWMSKLNNGSNHDSIFFAVVDCTGHGVPGAFMSMIGNRLLNEIVNEKKVTDPKDILEKLNAEIRIALRQEQTDNNDGMDISICHILKNDNNTISLSFAAAKRTAFVIKKERKEVIKLKGDRISIGGYSDSKESLIFHDHNLVLGPDDLLFLTTDGIIDQNAPDRTRFGSNRLEEVLFKYSKYSLEEQEYYIRHELDRFKQNEEQRDDITLIGLKFK